jgi:hypothetical protein
MVITAHAERQAALHGHSDTTDEAVTPVANGAISAMPTTELDATLLDYLDAQVPAVASVSVPDATRADPETHRRWHQTMMKVRTEPVQMTGFASHTPWMTMYRRGDIQGICRDSPGVVAPAESTPRASRIDTTTIRTITCSDDSYVLLVVMELRHTPAPTEDLRDVVARTLGGLVETSQESTSHVKSVLPKSLSL